MTEWVVVMSSGYDEPDVHGPYASRREANCAAYLLSTGEEFTGTPGEWVDWYFNTDDGVDVARLTRKEGSNMDEDRAINEGWVRGVAREEIASLCGLILRRLQDHAGPTRSIERNMATEEVQETLNAVFGEALRDFSDTAAEPGDADQG